VNDVAFSQFVEHGAYFGQSLGSSSFVGRLAQVAHSVTRCLSVIMIVCFASGRLADTLQRAFVICHLCCFVYRPCMVDTIVGGISVISFGLERISLRT